ncbi:GAK system XXXCH domain-containing protein [Pseudodesulfovibrio sp.]|uniref:GAK system XXXCH domain-containing protein n=1 Tax=unclassified Pseudodesulfovibrio TaxID=2661612 RepID=UPI003B003D3F
MGNNIKIQKYLDNKGLADFLRELADAVENGGKGELACLEGFREIKVGIKDEYGQLKLKAKIKPAGVCEEPETEAGENGEATGKPKYKSLKKRMKTSFRVLVKMVHDGQMPPKDAVEDFLADSALMVTYPGYGDEFYQSYTDACMAFKAAYEAGDLAKMHDTVDVLVHEKSRCHAKYD